MPVYTYECTQCGQRFDARQSFSDSPLTVCPNCGGKIRRVIQPVGVVFKGSGFYVTDSRGKQNLATVGKKEDGAKPAEGGNGNGGGSSTEGGSADKGESKSEPAPKPAAKPAATPAT